MSTNWVQTHRLSGWADSNGYCTIADVLGIRGHYIRVYADAQHRQPLGVSTFKVTNNGNRVNARAINGGNGFAFDLPGPGSNHHTSTQIRVGRGQIPVYICVWQNQFWRRR